MSSRLHSSQLSSTKQKTSHHSHIKTIPVQNTETVDFRYILKWKSCYSLVFHAIQVISTDLKFKNLNSAPYRYVMTVQTLYRKITSMLSFFMHLKHAPPDGTKTCCLYFSFQKYTRYLGDLRFPQQSQSILVFWNVTVCYCLLQHFKGTYSTNPGNSVMCQKTWILWITCQIRKLKPTKNTD